MARHLDDIATGHNIRRRLKIVGRPRQACTEKAIILEEADPLGPVPMHVNAATGRKKLPHFRANCPYCDGSDEPTPYWYVGCFCQTRRELAILEVTEKCFETLRSASQSIGPPEEIGRITRLLVMIARADFQYSPRVLRCEQRVSCGHEWQYRTREELARILGIAIKPRLFKAEGDSA